MKGPKRSESMLNKTRMHNLFGPTQIRRTLHSSLLFSSLDLCVRGRGLIKNEKLLEGGDQILKNLYLIEKIDSEMSFSRKLSW